MYNSRLWRSHAIDGAGKLESSQVSSKVGQENGPEMESLEPSTNPEAPGVEACC